MPGGRPTDYREDFARMAFVACSQDSFTDVKLAKLFNVSKATITIWKREHPEFLASIKSGKDAYNCAKAEDCLKKRLEGYDYTEKVKTKSKKTGKMVIVKTVTRHIPPDPKTLEFFLCNRDPSRWKRVKHVELTGADGGPLGVTHSLSKKDREALKAAAKSVALQHIENDESDEDDE